MIEIEGVGVVFGRTHALDSVTASIPEGITGIFGPNGSGKSTLLRVLAGLTKPTFGTVSWNGARLDHRDEAVRRAIGYAGHQTGLYARLSLRENLELFAIQYGVSRPRVNAILEMLELGPEADKPVAELSAGMKRRSAVARALLHDPQLLLLDEPYANVDDTASDRISDAIRSWAGDGRTALVATHGAKKVRAYAGAGLVLRRGRVARFGSYTAAETSP